jgi:hypothetical protein
MGALGRAVEPADAVGGADLGTRLVSGLERGIRQRE